MLAVETLFTLVFAAVCGHLVVSLPVDGEIVHPGPNTYTISEGNRAEVVVRRVPALQSEYAIYATPRNTPNGTYIFGELTPKSVSSFSMNINHPNLVDDLLTLNVKHYGSDWSFTFVEIFDTSADGRSGGTVRLLDYGIGSQSLIIVVQPNQPGGSVSLFLSVYSQNFGYGGNNFQFGRVTPGADVIYSVFVDNMNYNETGVVQTSHSIQLSNEITYIQGRDHIENGSGQLMWFQGGVGSSNFSFVLESGVGEDLNFDIFVYGVPGN